MYLNATSTPLFKQCGIYDYLVSFGKFVSSIQMCNEQGGLEYSIDFDEHDKL